MNYKDKPWLMYFILLLAFLASGFLWFFSEGFAENIMIELIGGILFIVIIDQLLLKSQRKRWNIVKEEIEYILARTINIIREDILFDIFSFKPDIELQSSETQLQSMIEIQKIEKSISEQKDNMFDQLLNMDSVDFLDLLKEKYLNHKYNNYFQNKADDLWEILNTKYTEHLNPEVVQFLLKLHLHMKDLHNSILTYKKSKNGPQKKNYYENKGSRNIIYNFKQIIECLIKLKKLGYSHSNIFIDEDENNL